MAIRKLSTSTANNNFESYNYADTYSIDLEYLVVAGGGAGGYDRGGGGGAGGMKSGTMRVSPLSEHTVTVGAGGALMNAYSATSANVGSNSVFSSITSNGGGYSAWGGAAAQTGGSGGGASSGSGNSGAAGISGQGNSGGNCPGGSYSGGGGGGAGAAGQIGLTGTGIASAGGEGLQSSISGILQWYAGGGGAGAYIDASPTINTGGAGGSGGGGAGANGRNAHGGNGEPNTGGGGGGGSNLAQGWGGAGGSGIVIIAYPSRFSNISTVSGSLSYILDTSTRPGFKVYKFISGTGTVKF